MNLNPPSRVRQITYIVTAVGSPIIGYLFAKHLVGELEVSLWGSLVTVVNIMAGINTSDKTNTSDKG